MCCGTLTGAGVERLLGEQGCCAKRLLESHDGVIGVVRQYQGANVEKLTQQNIQEAFLNNARKDKTFLTIYLMSGVKLSGRIKSFDKYSVILEASNQEQLIFKHAISTVVISKSTHSSGPHPAPGTPGPAPLMPPPTADTSQE
jgi:host factor-I protein